MNKNIGRGFAWELFLFAMGGFLGCATPAVVFVSPDYNPQQIKRVAVLGIADFPGQQGSGAVVADIFEKDVMNLHYELIDANQSEAASNDSASLAAVGKSLGVDAVITGSLSEFTQTSEQTVMVDTPQEETEPVYQDVTVQGRYGLRTITEQTGTQTVVTDQSTPETETLPARVGISVRLVSVKTGELLWSGSASEDGIDLSSAAEYAASQVIQALQKDFQKIKSSPTN